MLILTIFYSILCHLRIFNAILYKLGCLVSRKIKNGLLNHVQNGPLQCKSLFLYISTEIHSPWLKKFLKSIIQEFTRMFIRKKLDEKNLSKAGNYAILCYFSKNYAKHEILCFSFFMPSGRHDIGY